MHPDSSPSGEGGYFASPPPRVLAHRGLAVEAPENTLLAFAKAVAVGVSHLETDVHVSADGAAVISHDPTLTRTAGRSARVDELTVAQLGRVELGQGQGLPTLAEAMDAFPEARFNIDIKSADAVGPACEAITSVGGIERVLVTSFSSARRAASVAALPGVATSPAFGDMARILAAASLGLTGRARSLLARFDAVQLPERWRGVRVLSPGLLRLAHEVGVEVHAWTINDPKDMARLWELGIDGIVTDRADLAVEVLDSRS